MRSSKFFALHFRSKHHIHNFFGKSQSHIETKNDKIRRSKISFGLVSFLVTASWVVILKMWWGAEERAKIKMGELTKDADRYKRVGVSDHVLPEEFRPEYVIIIYLKKKIATKKINK
jgi:hypothetical protein